MARLTTADDVQPYSVPGCSRARPAPQGPGPVLPVGPGDGRRPVAAAGQAGDRDLARVARRPPRAGVGLSRRASGRRRAATGRETDPDARACRRVPAAGDWRVHRCRRHLRLVAGWAVGGRRRRRRNRVKGLFKIPVDGGEPVRLTTGTAFDPVWSPTEDLIVYAGAKVGGQAPLLAVRPDGSACGTAASANGRLHHLWTASISAGWQWCRVREGGRGGQPDFWLLDLTARTDAAADRNCLDHESGRDSNLRHHCRRQAASSSIGRATTRTSC